MKNKKANWLTKAQCWLFGSTRMWWSKIDDGKWHYVVVNQKHGKAKQIWIDGVEIGLT